MGVERTHRRITRYLLDTSALLTLSDDEQGAERVEALLLEARRGEAQVYMSCMSAMEAGYKMYQRRSEQGLVSMLAYLQKLPIIRIDINDELIALAARMKVAYRLSLADAWVLATARQLGAVLVHKDPDFEQAQTEVQLQALPYKQPSA